MSTLRQAFGMDGIDLLIHAGVTAAALFFVRASGGPFELAPVLVGLSLLVLGVRRHLALRGGERRGLSSGEMAAERIAELEQRLGDLETAQERIVELEERLDFTERLLAKLPAEPRGIGSGDAP